MKNETIGNMKILLKKLGNLETQHYFVSIHTILDSDKVFAKLKGLTTLPNRRPKFERLYTL